MIRRINNGFSKKTIMSSVHAYKYIAKYALKYDNYSQCSLKLVIICYTMLSQCSVRILKIPCHSKDMAFSIKCMLFCCHGERV